MAIEFSNVRAFSEMSPDLYNATKKYGYECIAERKGLKAFESMKKEEMEELINKEFVSELEKQVGFGVKKFGETKDAVRRYAGTTAVKEFANAIKDNMIDMILPEVLLSGALPYIAEIKTAELGDSLKFDIENNQLFTVSKAGYRKRHTNMQKLFKTTVTMVGENHEVTVGADLFEILTGQANIAKDVMKVALSIEAQMLYASYDAFTTSMNALSGNLQVANYAETSLIKLCETVTAYNQGRKAVILGTPSALKSVLPSNNNYRYLLDSEYVKLGHLQTFNGYDVIPMEQVANYTSNDYSLKLDSTKIYVVSPASDKIVKIGVFGGSYTHMDGNDASANKMVLNTTEKAWEVATVTNSVGGVVSSLS